MFASYGLYGQMQKHLVRSAVLLAGFTVLIVISWYAWCILAAAFIDGHAANSHASLPRPLSVAGILSDAAALAVERWWVPLLFTAAWFLVAYAMYADMLRFATGARSVTRTEAPQLYKAVETLAISAGLPMPRVEVIPSDALNAYASGLGPDDACITVTRGLTEALNTDELEAVLAHEMIHIRNRDIRLLVIATVFAGGLTLVGRALGRLWSRRSGIYSDNTYGYGSSEPTQRSSKDSGGAIEEVVEAEGGQWMAIVISVVIAIAFLAMAHVSALMIKFAISRSREFLADAGAVDLTKNPDALVSALRKISGHDQIAGVDGSLQAMMFSAEVGTLFSTHPPIEARIMALRQYAGAIDLPQRSKGATVGVLQAGGSFDGLRRPTVGAFAASGGRPVFGRRNAV